MNKITKTLIITISLFILISIFYSIKFYSIYQNNIHGVKTKIELLFSEKSQYEIELKYRSLQNKNFIVTKKTDNY
jgi:hypothetical protein